MVSDHRPVWTIVATRRTSPPHYTESAPPRDPGNALCVSSDRLFCGSCMC